MWRHRLAFAVLFAIVTGAVGACGAGNDDGAISEDATTVLRRGNGGDPGSLDPAKAQDEHAFRILADLYEGLVAFDATGSIVPGVASDWSISDDGLVYTFQLRTDALWSNGEPVTAANFVAGFQRTLAPDAGSPYSFLLQPVRNAEAIQGGETPVSALGVTAIDETTLVIELEAPAPHFLSVLATAIALPLPPSIDAGSHRYSDPAVFVGNGPYLLQDWQPGHRIRLVKNPHFRDADAVAIEQIEYYAVHDLQTELNMYRAGELDITASVPGPHIRAMGQERSPELRIAPKLGLYYLALDLSEAPLDDLALRKALSMAIDRDVLVDVIGRGEAPAFGVVPDGIDGYAAARYEWRTLSRDEREAEARRSFAASSLAGESAPQLRLTYDTGDIHETVALTVSSMWREVLGLEVELDKREWQYFLDTRDQRDEWQVMRFAWVGDYNHASTFTDLFHSGSPQNLPGYASDQYDQLLADSLAERNRDDQNKSLADAEAILLADYAIAPLYFFVSKHFVSPAVEGFEHNALDVHPSRYLRLTTPASP